jgi:hypothetical protein
MSKAIIYLFALALYFCTTTAVKAENIDVTVRVLASPSKGVTLGVNTEIGGIDIKKIDIPKIAQGSSIPTKLTLVNITGDDRSIDRVELTAARLDGTTELSENVKINEYLKSGKEVTLDLDYPSNLGPGDYIGKFSVYSENQLLGSSKTIISIKAANPEVLGASTANYSSSYILAFAVFLLLFLMTLVFVFTRKRSFLQTTISFELFDLVGVITGVSAFGLGVFSGYTLGNFFSPLGTLIVTNDYYLLPSVALFVIALVVEICILVKKASSLLKIKIAVKLFDVIVIITGVSAFGLGVLGGYALGKTFLPSVQRQESSKTVSESNPPGSGDNIAFVYGQKSLPLYVKPDSTTQVVYELKQNADLRIIDQAAGWYRILLGSGTNGWVRIEDVRLP